MSVHHRMKTAIKELVSETKVLSRILPTYPYSFTPDQLVFLSSCRLFQFASPSFCLVDVDL